MNRISFNYGLTDITPKEQLLLDGYANRTGLSGRIHRKLSSRCLVLRYKDTGVCIIVNDLTDVHPGIVSRITSQISGEADLKEDQVILISTHTHSAPVMEYGRHEANDHYIDAVIRIIAENCIRLVNDTDAFREVSFRKGTALCNINIASRDVRPDGKGISFRIGDPEGLCDEEVGILELADETDERKVTLFNYSCHPVTLGYDSNYISTDFPGKAREIVELTKGGMAVFLNGASGDINPRRSYNIDTRITDDVGRHLGQAIISTGLTSNSRKTDLRIITETVNLPFRDQYITRDHIAYEARRKAVETTGFFNWKEILGRWEKQICGMIEKNEIRPYLPVKISILKLGKTIILFTQGELFVSYQLELKKKFRNYQLFCVSYAHGAGVYIPTAWFLANKTYESDKAYIYEGLPSPLSPGAERIYLGKVVDTIKMLLSK